MELSALAPASSGQVEVLELLWPPVPEASDGQRSCVCYVLMVRSDGFLLCVPAGFFSPEELATGGDDGAISPAPSLPRKANGSQRLLGTWCPRSLWTFRQPLLNSCRPWNWIRSWAAFW